MKLSLDAIKPNPDNPRLIKDDAFKKLVKSIKEFPEMLDARELVLNKDHVILGGNMRFKAAKEAGLKEVPVKIVDWPEDKQREFVIKDNVSGGEWDWDLLANEWDAELLNDWGLDTPDDWNEEKEVEEDEAPEVSDEPAISKLGEVYQLGRHRLMCGDSTDFGQVSDLMNGNLADLIFTDPPYGVGYEQGKFTGKNVKKKFEKIANDELKAEDLYNFTKKVFDVVNLVSTDNCPYYVWSPPMQEGYEIHKAIKDSGVHIQSQIIWDKQRLILGRADYHWQHEICWYGYKKDDTNHYWNGGRKQTTIWQQTKDNNYQHPTQKPVELGVRALNNSCKENGIVLDVFLGSGSTLIAAEQTDHICYGMELDPKYVDVIRKRYHKFVTGSEDGWEDGTPAIRETAETTV